MRLPPLFLMSALAFAAPLPAQMSLQQSSDQTVVMNADKAGLVFVEESYVEVAKRIARDTPNSFYTDQYYNMANPEAHYLTNSILRLVCRSPLRRV